MSVGIVGMITAALTLMASVLGMLAKNKEAWEENRDDINTQRLRQALADDRAIDAVAADQHDRVQQALSGDLGGRDGVGEEEHA